MKKVLLLLASLLITSLTMAQKIKLGEDIKEIRAYTKNLYKVGGRVYIDLDLVTITYRNIDERVVVNKSTKIRTYIVDQNTLIYADNCKEVSPSELLKRKAIILKKKAIVVVGASKNGKMVSVNFGCYE